jgi:O-antigen ligase
MTHAVSLPLSPARYESKPMFFLFSLWSLILLCRPQDYLLFLREARPTLTVGLVVLFAYFLTSRKAARISDNPQFRLYRWLLLVMLAGIPFSYYISASLKDAAYYAIIGMMFFYLFYQLITSVDKLLRILFVFCSGVAVYALYIASFGKFLKERISFGTMFDPNDIAFFILSFLAFNLLFLTRENGSLKRCIVAVNILVGLFVILKTGSRGGLIALILASLYLLFSDSRAIRLSVMARAALIGMTLASLPFMAINSERYKTILDLHVDYNMTDEEGRLAIWKTGIKLMLTHPLTGIGVNRFSEGVGREREKRGLASAKWQAPHNSLVQIGAETGIIGLLLFAGLSLKAFRIFGRAARQAHSAALTRIGILAKAGFVGHFISSMFLSQAYSIYWIFYIVLSAVLSRFLKGEPTASPDGMGAQA